MTGTTGDIIPIVIVPVIALAFWLSVVYYSGSHPQWSGQAPPDAVPTDALEGRVPVQRLGSPGAMVPGPRPSAAADEASLARARAGGTRQADSSGGGA